MCDCNKYITTNKFNCKPKCHERKQYQNKKTQLKNYEDSKYDNNNKCSCKPVRCPPQTKCQCPCNLYDCEIINHGICPEVNNLIDKFVSIANNASPDLALLTSQLTTVLTGDVVLVFVTNLPPAAAPPFPPNTTIANPAANIPIVAQTLIQFVVTAGGPINRIKTDIIQQDCYTFITTGTFTVIPIEPTPTNPIRTTNAIIRYRVRCDKGQLKISFIEVFTNFEVIFQNLA